MSGVILAAGLFTVATRVPDVGDLDKVAGPGPSQTDPDLSNEEGIPSPTFHVPAGWFTGNSGILPAATTDQPGAWASTYDFSEADYRNLYPRLGELPTGGIAIEVSIIAAEDFPHEPNVNFPERNLPLRLPAADALTTWEGQTTDTDDFSRYRILANVRGELVDVSVYFATQDPSREMYQSAGDVLRTLRLPRGEESEQSDVRGQIAFLSDRGQQIFLINADGSGLDQVTRSLGYSSRIDWSPDGGRIVMDRALGKGRGSLVIVEVQTGEESVVLSDGDNAGRTALNPSSPSWSPDGSRIAFNSGTGDIYIIDVDGRGLERVTHSERTCGHLYPDWSPDGTRIAFSRDCRGGGVYVVSVGGGPIERVTDNRRDLQPAWSPDGDQIAWSRGGGGGGNIFVIDLASGDVVQLTEEIDNYAPSWSPDGSAIVFGTNREGTQDIWIMDADGTDESPLTRDRPVDSAPVWRP
jgi:dipeptidyl aminopeptidase/acylaminoacyl peptidase